MQKPSDLPKGPGVYMLLCPVLKIAYVGKCANVRHRAAIWKHHFKKLATDPNHPLPVRHWPRDKPEAMNGDNWEFGHVKHSVEALRAAIVEGGYTLLNDETRVRADITYLGRTASLIVHCRELGVPYTRAYYRLKAGKPLPEVFAKE